MGVNFDNETEHETSLGNYKDCIYNLVYGVQRYIDKFYNYIPLLYKDSDSFGEYSDLATFLIGENENVIKLKCIHFAIESNNLIIRKHEKLHELIQKCPEGTKYLLSSDSMIYFMDQQDYIDWDKLTSKIYSKKVYETIDDIYKFNHYVDERLNFYKSYAFNDKQKYYTPEEAITVIDVCFIKLTTTFVRLKELMESSNSMYNSALILRVYIDMLVMSYTAISCIEEVNN